MALLIIQQKPQEKMCVIETLYLLFLGSKQLLSKRHIFIKIIFFPNQYFLPLGYYFLEGFSAFFFFLISACSSWEIIGTAICCRLH